jgi:hypothetical protein
MTSSIENIPKDDLVHIGLWGAGLWIVVLVALGLVPSAPDGDYEFPSPARLAAAGVILIGWMFAVFFAVLSLRIRGSGTRFQFFRVIALAPVWLFAVLPPAYVLLLVALTYMYR